MRCEYHPGIGSFYLINCDGNSVPYEWRLQTLLFPKDEFRGFIVKIATEVRVVQVSRETVTLSLARTEQGFSLLDGLLKPRWLRPVSRIGFEGNERWGNGRGFI